MPPRPVSEELVPAIGERHAAPAKPPSAAATAAVTTLAAMFAGCKWAEYGSAPRALFQEVLDVSPSVIPFKEEAKKSGEALSADFQNSVVARNRLDTMTLSGAEGCLVSSFAHGKFERPEVRFGSGTYALPWLEGAEASVGAWREALADLGIPTSEGITVVESDFMLSDLYEVDRELPGWKARMKAMGQVVIACAYGEPDFAVAAKFSDLPVVDLNAIPLAALLRMLGASLTTSIGRPGSLEGLVRVEIARLQAAKGI